MAEREFTITELKKAGDGGYIDTPVKFVWTNANYAAPRGSWRFGVEQRSVREDYPGTEEPVEQVLGPNYKEFDLQGCWDDRYGGEGFALRTHREFEALVQRGSLCRFEFETISIVGLIKNADFDYLRSTYIMYSFSVSPHYRVSGGLITGTTIRRRAAEAFRPVTEYRDQAIAAADFMDAVQKAAIEGAIAKATSVRTMADTTSTLQSLRNAVDKVTSSVNQRLDPTIETFEGLRRIANSLAVVKGAAAGMLTNVASLKTSVNMSWDNAVNALDFDVWRTDLSRYSRTLALTGHEGRDEINRRAEPKAVALYRPRKGESLYSISQRFYGTPSMWREIASRNGLTSMTLQGTELLIIPERR